MVDFKKLLKLPRPEKFDWHYRCLACGEMQVFICEMPEHLMKHGLSRRDRCRGALEFVRKEPRA